MRSKKEKQTRNFSTSFVRKGLKILRLNVTEQTEHLLVQIFNFGIVGVVATFIDFIFLYFFKEMCHFHVVIANTLSFIISVIYNYWASLTFVFDVNPEKSRKKNFIIFMICSVIGLCLNDVIVWGVTDKLGIYYLLSKAIATIVVMVFNFVTRKKFLE